MLTTIVEQSAHLQPQGLQPQGLQPVSEHMSPHACSPAKAGVAADALKAPPSRVSASAVSCSPAVARPPGGRRWRQIAAMRVGSTTRFVISVGNCSANKLWDIHQYSVAVPGVILHLVCPILSVH